MPEGWLAIYLVPIFRISVWYIIIYVYMYIINAIMCRHIIGIGNKGFYGHGHPASTKQSFHLSCIRHCHRFIEGLDIVGCVSSAPAAIRAAWSIFSVICLLCIWIYALFGFCFILILCSRWSRAPFGKHEFKFAKKNKTENIYYYIAWWF